MRSKRPATLLLIASLVIPALSPLNASAGTSMTKVTIRVEHVGGFIGPNIKTARLPDVVMYADGRVLAHREVTGSVMQMYQGFVNPLTLRSQISTFLRLSKTPVGGWGQPRVADVPTTQILINHNGKRNIANIYALGFTSTNLPKTTIAARTDLSKAINALIKLGGRSTLYKPSTYEVWPMWVVSDATTPVITWPKAVAPPTGRCTSVAAKPFVSLMGAAAKKEWLLPSGRMVSLTWRPVLPGETACRR